MEDVEVTWKILTSASEEREYEGIAFGRGLKEFFAKNGENTAGKIFFSPASEDILQPFPAWIHFTVLASNDFASSAFTLLKAAMGDPSFHFSITADFAGFLPENAPADGIPDLPAFAWDLDWLPKFSEFTHPDLLKNRPCFSKEISLSVRGKAADL